MCVCVRESDREHACDSERVYTCIRVHEISLARHFYFKIINTHVSGASEAKKSVEWPGKSTCN